MIFKVQNTSKRSIHPILLGTQHCGKLLERHHHLQVSLTSFGLNTRFISTQLITIL